MERIAQIKEYLQQSPNDNFLVHALALEYVKAGDDKEATKYFEQNLIGTPTYIATYYHLGKLQERCGDSRSAIVTYQLGMEQAKKANDQHSYSELRSVYEELTY